MHEIIKVCFVDFLDPQTVETNIICTKLSQKIYSC